MAKSFLVGQNNFASNSEIKELNDKITALQTVTFYVDIEGEGVGGITVTATCGSAVVKGTTDSNGKCVLKTNVLGTYTITYDTAMESATSKVSVNSYGMYIISGISNKPFPVGYLMLYDQGDECSDVTGGWSISDNKGTGRVKEANRLLFQPNHSTSVGHFYTNKVIDISSYDKIGMHLDYNGIGGGTDYNLRCNYAYPSTSGKIFCFLEYDSKACNKVISGSTLGLKNIVVQITQICNTEHGGVSGSIGHIYEVFLFKNDDWITWLIKAGLNPSSYADLDTVLNNVSAMDILGNSSEAINYMIRCSGTIMGGVLSNDTAFNAMSSAAKQKMAANSHWSKFATIYGRTL